MSTNPITTVRTPAQSIARLDMMQRGARACMITAFAVAIALLVIHGDDTGPLLAALHVLNIAITLLVIVGALEGHRAMIQQEQHTQELMQSHARQTDAQLQRLADLERRLLEIAEGHDELESRRADRNGP